MSFVTKINLKKISLALISGFLINASFSHPSSSAVKSGASCKKIGASATKAGVNFQCQLKSGKKVWVVKSKKSSAAKDKAAAGATTTTPTTTPSTSAAGTTTSTTEKAPALPKKIAAPTPGISIYRGGPGSSVKVNEKSFELPMSVTAPPAGANLKLWVYDPEDKSKPLGSTGIFYQKSGENWVFLNSNSDGSVYGTLSEGKYFIDTVEPGGRAADYIRKRYELSVSPSGEVSVSGLDPNSRGIFTITIITTKTLPVVEVAKPKFVPASACQLEDQTTNIRGMVGFPKPEYRLPSEGKINALIIPIDFPDVNGKGEPKEIFAAMTDGTAKFFYEQSGGRVQFNFQTIEKWVRAPFLSSAYRLGQWSGGDSTGYFGAALALADPLVDYSLFDVVYVLSPKEIPSSSIAYGPAFVSMPGDIYATTNEGLVSNGSFSGADAWQNIPGAGWKWMAHETGHLFGLHDLYVVEGNPPYGSWDIMSLNWTTQAIALNAWNRYLLGWLDESQVSCIERSDLGASKEVKLIPIERDAAGIKAAMVPLSSSKMLVAELRRSEGFDSLFTTQEGVLIYTVDMTIESIKGGWNTQRRVGSVALDFSDATLKPGDKITVDSIVIEVLKRELSGDTIKISRG